MRFTLSLLFLFSAFHFESQARNRSTEGRVITFKECRDCSQAQANDPIGDLIRATAPRKCDLNRVAANARRIGSRTVSRHMCLPSARLAYKQAGCEVPADYAHNAMHSWRGLQNKWHCERSNPRSAPDGASVFSVGCGSHHTEIKVGSCFYSDFHSPDCLGAHEYQGCAYKLLGWCVPR